MFGQQIEISWTILRLIYINIYPKFGLPCMAQSRDFLHNLEIVAQTRDPKFVQAQSRDCENREFVLNINTADMLISFA